MFRHKKFIALSRISLITEVFFFSRLVCSYITEDSKRRRSGIIEIVFQAGDTEAGRVLSGTNPVSEQSPDRQTCKVPKKANIILLKPRLTPYLTCLWIVSCLETLRNQLRSPPTDHPRTPFGAFFSSVTSSSSSSCFSVCLIHPSLQCSWENIPTKTGSDRKPICSRCLRTNSHIRDSHKYLHIYKIPQVHPTGA